MKTKILIIALIIVMMIPAVKAAATLEVTAFSCNPSEVKLGSQFSCTATIQNTGDASGTLNTATLYPDANNWLEDATYPVTANTALSSGASASVTFSGMKGKKSGNNGFSKIMIDDVSDNFVADNNVRVNVIDIIVTASASAGSGTSGGSVDVVTQATAGGNADVVLSFSLSGTGCTIGSQSSTATSNEMTDGQSTSHTWTVTIGTANCSYSVSAQATSNPGSIISKTDTSSGAITCTNCVVSDNTTTTTTSGSGGGGGGGGVAGETQTIAKDLIKKGETAEFKYTTAILAVTQIDVIASNEMTKTELKVARYTGLPSSISAAPSNNVYRYIEFTATNLSSIEKAVVKFKINKTWISDNGLDSDKIYLYRYTVQWDKLVTSKTLTDSGYYYYQAETPGFSYFAIAGEPIPVAISEPEKASTSTEQTIEEQTPEKTAETPAEAKPVIEKPLSIPTDYIYIIAVLVIVLLAGWFYYHGHKKFVKK